MEWMLLFVCPGVLRVCLVIIAFEIEIILFICLVLFLVTTHLRNISDISKLYFVGIRNWVRECDIVSVELGYEILLFRKVKDANGM